jgi:hypothetical protein
VQAEECVRSRQRECEKRADACVIMARLGSFQVVRVRQRTCTPRPWNPHEPTPLPHVEPGQAPRSRSGYRQLVFPRSFCTQL